jgi:hypothetical protein
MLLDEYIKNMSKDLLANCKEFFTKRKPNSAFWAGVIHSGNKFFIDLWNPGAIETIDNPDLDKHPRVRVIT